MLVVNSLRENKDNILKKLTKKGFDAKDIIERVLENDSRRKTIIKDSEEFQAKVNKNTKMFGMLVKQNDTVTLETLRTENNNLNNIIATLKDELVVVEENIHNDIILLPNVPHESVPEGRSAADNELVIQVGGIVPTINNPLPHWDLIKKHNLIDFELGVKITGKGFPVYKDKAAKLQRALINFFLDEAENAGYKEVQVPILVNKDSGYGTGQLPDKDGQMYNVTADNLYAIPTAEVPITNIYRNVILKPEELPIKHVGYTPCFRREAGTWGADVRGLNRLHQFDKVEIVQITTPEQSYQTLEEMVKYVESLLVKLELPYRILKLCAGDMSFTSALTYDFEVYSAAQGRWLEVSSVSNFETYQANRLKLRTKQGLLHTLNGSALALPRIVAAILENYQTEDGINIPKVLHTHLRFNKI